MEVVDIRSRIKYRQFSLCKSSRIFFLPSRVLSYQHLTRQMRRLVTWLKGNFGADRRSFLPAPGIFSRQLFQSEMPEKRNEKRAPLLLATVCATDSFVAGN